MNLKNRDDLDRLTPCLYPNRWAVAARRVTFSKKSRQNVTMRGSRLRSSLCKALSFSISSRFIPALSLTLFTRCWRVVSFQGAGGGWFGLKSFESESLALMGMEKMVVHVLGRLFFIKRLVPVHGCWPSGVFSIHGGKSVYILTVGCLNWVSTKVTTTSRRRSVAFQLTDWPLIHSPVAL